MNTTESLRGVMRDDGLDFNGEIVADGKLHRFKAAGDPGKNSWYVLHAGPPAAGAFGCWKRQIKHAWHGGEGRQLTPAEREAVHRRIVECEQAREREENLRRLRAQKLAQWILTRSEAADPAHPYLVKKAVQPHGDIHQYRGSLVLPLRDADGVLHSLQFIGADGEKRFLTGGPVEGCCFTIADNGAAPMILCEGLATGLSIFEATNHAVYCAMHAGNLLGVAQALRAKWPKRDTIIAADNDQFTDGNPGTTKATEAARAIGARLAIPRFKSAENKPTDFNDMSQLFFEGPPAVKAQIDAAVIAPESQETAIARLAKLTALEYETARKLASEKLGIRTSILDALVESARGGSTDDAQGHTVNLPEVKPWPESVDGADMLDEVAKRITEYVAMPDGAVDACSLWLAHAHCFDAFECTPRLNPTSPDKGCGKSVLCDVLACFAPRPLLTENLTVAVLFRIIEARRPTIIADEYDSWIKDNEELRGMLNAGHRRGGQALRCEGDKNEVRAFNVFAPAVLAGIGNLPGTLHDRSIPIRLARAKPGEVKARFDSRHTEHEQELCRKLARWCTDNRARIESCDPMLPEGAFNRLADNWRPLLAIAEVAGGDWPERARRAFGLLTASEDQDAQGIGAMLLADIKVAFGDDNKDRLFSKELVERLLAMTDRPWGEIRKDRPVTEAWVAHRLRAFGVTSRKIRVGDEARQGYLKESFTEAWERYIPISGETNWNTGTEAAKIGGNAVSEMEHASNLFHSEKPTSPNKDGACSTVPLPKTPAPPKAQPTLAPATTNEGGLTSELL